VGSKLLITIAVGSANARHDHDCYFKCKLAMMILWANIFVDVPPSLSLGVDPVEEDIMLRPPRSSAGAAGVLNRLTLLVIGLHAFQIAVLILILFWYTLEVQDYSVGYARSSAWIALATVQVRE